MRIEVRITSGSYDYNEYYLGSAHFYECWGPDDIIPDSNPVYKRWISTNQSPIKCSNPQDAQLCARNLAAWIIQFRGYNDCTILDNKPVHI